MEYYPRLKTVRFKQDTWELIKLAASEDSVTTSEYIRAIVAKHVDVS